jgi:hypothetical protein
MNKENKTVVEPIGYVNAEWYKYRRGTTTLYPESHPRIATSPLYAAPQLSQPVEAGETCAHDYVRSDSVCTECGEKSAVVLDDERVSGLTDGLRSALEWAIQASCFEATIEASAARGELEAILARTGENESEALDIAERLEEISERITRFSNLTGDGIAARAAQLLREFAAKSLVYTAPPVHTANVAQDECRDAFDVMHRRAMNAEANVRELVSQARAASPQATATLTDAQRQAILHQCRLYLDDESGKYNAKSVLTRIFSITAEQVTATQPVQTVNAVMQAVETGIADEREEVSQAVWKAIEVRVRAALTATQPAQTERALTDDARDADRYRRLRAQQWNSSDLFVVAGGKSVVRLGTECPTHDRLDALVDALTAAQPASGGDHE